MGVFQFQFLELFQTSMAASFFSSDFSRQTLEFLVLNHLCGTNDAIEYFRHFLSDLVKPKNNNQELVYVMLMLYFIH